MDYNIYVSQVQNGAGVPYDDIVWHDIEGQPFGLASRFNLLVFNDANNIIDVEGPVAIGGNFYSPRGLSVGFERDSRNQISYSPDLVRFLVGGNVSMGGPLVVVGQVVVGGSFNAAKGSTYLIGKDGTPDQEEELDFLYQASGGSRYWTITDRGDHFVVPSYDVPRFVPASRIGANLPLFFQNARQSIENYMTCIEALPVNGTVVDNFHELILRGSDPRQNVFLIDARPNGLLNKGLRAQVPAGSLVIIRLLTGNNAHLQYGVYGEESKADRTLYVFEDATNIYMEKSSDIWGSILAPNAMFHAHRTGGHVSGTAVLRAFAVNGDSGFEFHYFPFVGGIVCEKEQAPAAEPISEITPVPVPEPVPCPECPECPKPEPCPICPEPESCPEPPPCPECPKPEPCPECPECPTCPEQEPCPECPPCPEPSTEYVVYPVPVPVPVVEKPECPVKPECKIIPGLIMGCVWGCQCCKPHEWEVKLFKICDDTKRLLYCQKICGYGCFEFKVPYEGCYTLTVCPADNFRLGKYCKPVVSLKNIGVSNFMYE